MQIDVTEARHEHVEDDFHGWLGALVLGEAAPATRHGAAALHSGLHRPFEIVEDDPPTGSQQHVNEHEAESRASDYARQRDDLSWKKYAKRLNKYLAEMEKLFWPDLFIVGGGISKKSEKYIPLLTINTPVIPAQFLNEAGIVGAALAARTE